MLGSHHTTMALQAINVEGLSLDKFLEYHVNNNGWTLEKGGQVLSNNHTPLLNFDCLVYCTRSTILI
jgi:hypothetical protein